MPYWGCRLKSPSLACALLALILATPAAGAAKKSRVFDAGYEQVWMAGVEVAKEAFYHAEIPRQEGRLRFRTGVFRGYRFDVGFFHLGPGKTRVEMELRADPGVLESFSKDAWRHGDRYLQLVGERVQRGIPK